MPETVYDRLLQGGTSIEDETVTVTDPTSIEISLLDEDPRKITLYCSCGHEAMYSFRAAKRVMPVCSSSACMKKALPKMEEWAKAAASRSWSLLTEEDIFNPPPKPKLPIRQEIRDFQEEVGLTNDGILGESTKKALRDRGREGMIPVWTARLMEEFGVRE